MLIGVGQNQNTTKASSTPGLQPQEVQIDATLVSIRLNFRDTPTRNLDELDSTSLGHKAHVAGAGTLRRQALRPVNISPA